MCVSVYFPIHLHILMYTQTHTLTYIYFQGHCFFLSLSPAHSFSRSLFLFLSLYNHLFECKPIIKYMIFQWYGLSLMCVRMHLTPRINIFGASLCVYVCMLCVCVCVSLRDVGLTLSMKFFLLFGITRSPQCGISTLF